MQNVLNRNEQLDNGTTVPAILGESVYKFSANKRAQDTDDDLVVWKTDKVIGTSAPAGRCKANCDIDFHQQQQQPRQGRQEWQQRSMSVEELDEEYQCACIETINKLKAIFQLPDEEIDFPRPARNTFPEDLVVVAFDSDEDGDVGDNLDLCDFGDSTEQCSDLSDISIDGCCSEDHRDDERLTSSRVEENNSYSSERNGSQTIAVEPNPPDKKLLIERNQLDHNPVVEKHVQEQPEKNCTATPPAKAKKRFKCCMEVDSVPAVGNTDEKKKPKEVQYVYTYGDDFRRVRQFGHKGCVQCWSPIPKNKGWITSKFAYRDLSKCHKLNQPEQNKNEEKQIADTNLVDDNLQVVENVELQEQSSNVTVATKTSGGAEHKKSNAEPTLVLNKENGAYTITMNFLTADNTTSPTVFKLGECPNADDISSGSSFDVELITPKILDMMHDKYGRKDKSTIYRPEDLVDKKKTVRSARQQSSQHSQKE